MALNNYLNKINSLNTIRSIQDGFLAFVNIQGHVLIEHPDRLIVPIGNDKFKVFETYIKQNYGYYNQPYLLGDLTTRFDDKKVSYVLFKIHGTEIVAINSNDLKVVQSDLRELHYTKHLVQNLDL